MTQNEVPVSEEAFDIFTFLSGMGLWIILALFWWELLYTRN